MHMRICTLFLQQNIGNCTLPLCNILYYQSTNYIKENYDKRETHDRELAYNFGMRICTDQYEGQTYRCKMKRRKISLGLHKATLHMYVHKFDLHLHFLIYGINTFQLSSTKLDSLLYCNMAIQCFVPLCENYKTHGALCLPYVHGSS